MPCFELTEPMRHWRHLLHVCQALQIALPDRGELRWQAEHRTMDVRVHMLWSDHQIALTFFSELTFQSSASMLRCMAILH